MLKVKGYKGITLIALIITIIVLLILAGVTISQITGSENAMEKATEAREKDKQGTELEAIKLAVVNSVASGLDGFVDTTSLKSGLNGLIQENPEDVIVGDSPWIVTSPSGRVYEINKNSTVNEVTGLILTPNKLTLTIEGDTYEEKTITARLIDIEGTLTWSASTDIIDVTPLADGMSATIKAKSGGTDTITVTCSNGDTSTCSVTVTDEKPFAIDTLLINDNFSPYVKYTDANGNVITCRVLYNDNQHGLQIISNSSVQDIELGYQDPIYKDEEGATQLSTAKNSYTHAIEYLNNCAHNYLNTNLAYDTRCIGSNSTVNNNSFINKNIESIGEDGHIAGDTNYEEDYDTMESLNITYWKNYCGYWLASRNAGNNVNGYYVHDVRSIYRDNFTTFLETNDFWYKKGNYESMTTNRYLKGLRPVFLIKSDVKVKSGDGLTENTAFVLQ